MAHPNARLSEFGRQLLVSRVVVQRWPAAEVARQLGVSRATVYKWVRRYRAEGSSGLVDRSCRPHLSPRRLPDEQLAAILRTRTRRRYGPHRLAPL
ncbi:MAG: helix-turn-helix domain-containing protein, partial [Erythrobacter sp.]|nr:helix-turn-helix domain-containing protein [Erythrobacter sp.]